MRKVMRGGEGEKTSEIFLESNTSVPTIKLKLSDKFMSKKKKLSIDINLELYNQDVRKLLCQLFNIDPQNCDKKEYFLIGLADMSERNGTINTANQLAAKSVTSTKQYSNIVYDNSGNDLEKIKNLSNRVLENPRCELEIELTQEDDNILFEVTNYSRIKYDTYSSRYYQYKWDESGGRCVDYPDDCEGSWGKYSYKIEFYYPKLDLLASSNPAIGGINYIDWETNKIYKGVSNNNYKFTVKGRTIEDFVSQFMKKKIVKVN
jgi:hypothetical protein